MFPVKGSEQYQRAVGALGNAVVGITVNDDQIAMNGDEGGVPEGAAGKGDRQLRVETAHDVAGPPASPDVRVDDHQDDEEQRAQVVDAQADNEDVGRQGAGDISGVDRQTPKSNETNIHCVIPCTDRDDKKFSGQLCNPHKPVPLIPGGSVPKQVEEDSRGTG